MGTSSSFFVSMVSSVSGLHWLATLLKFLVPTIVLLTLMFKGHQNVPTGHEALKRRWGRVVVYHRGPNKDKPKVYTAGLALQVPWADGMWHNNIQLDEVGLAPQVRKSADGEFEDVYGRMFYRSVNTPLTLMVAKAPVEQIVAIGDRILSSLVRAGYDYAAIETMFVEQMKAPVAVYGIEVPQIEISAKFSEATQYGQAVARATTNPLAVAATGPRLNGLSLTGHDKGLPIADAS